jgi:DNA-binding XRE family transcriptional regulator
MKNNIRSQRHKLGLTQKQLAKLVGTSQQQIQRIEVGEYVKLDLALKICEALKNPIEKIFPSTKVAIAKLKRKDPAKRQESDPEVDEAMDSAGIDVDPAQWTVRFRLRNGLEGAWGLSSSDKEQLVRNSRDSDKKFFCGTSRNAEFAANLRHLSFFQPCFDFGVIDEESDELHCVRIYLADSPTPMTFQVDPDTEWKEDEEDEGEFRNLLYSLDMMEDDSHEDPVISFVDEDAERAFFRTDQIALIEIPLFITHPEMEDDDDDESTKITS